MGFHGLCFRGWRGSLTLIYGCDEGVSRWVSRQLGYEQAFCNYKAIGVGLDGNFIAGVVYHDMVSDPQGSPVSIEMSVASIDKRWASRHNLKAFFQYPFTDLCVRRVETLCSANDEGVIMFNKRLGFTQEGFHKEAWPLGGDAISWGMQKEGCKWL